MEKHLDDWLAIITGMANNNTYKLAWGRAIVECAMLQEYKTNEEYAVISFDVLALKMLRYYWNQVFFFNLKQGPNQDKPPVLYQIAQEVIKQYKYMSSSSIPVWFDKAQPVLFKHAKFQTSIVNQLTRTISQDVCWRFLRANNHIYDIYILDLDLKEIRFKQHDILIVKEYGSILIQLLNYRWAQLLEQFNHSPKIASKVKGSQSESNIRRKNLTKFKDLLLCEFDDKVPRDFYTDMVLQEGDITIDHVIPWSYMYSDDIWNLVFTSRTYNSKKSNNIPKQEDIDKLMTRNERLLDKIEAPHFRNELFEATQTHLVQRYYLDLLG